MAAARHRHERGVLDTSTLILLPRLESATVLPAEPLITAITLAELSLGPLVADGDEERGAKAGGTGVRRAHRGDGSLSRPSGLQL